MTVNVIRAVHCLIIFIFFFFGRYFIVFILSAQLIKRSLVSAAVTEQTARSKVCCLPTLQSAPLCNFIEKLCYIVSARLQLTDC